MNKNPLHWISLLLVIIFFSSCSTNQRNTRKQRSYSEYSYSNKNKKRNKRSTKKTIRATNRSKIVAQARKYKGIPYQYGGKKPSNGFDCSGFSTFVLNKEGCQLSGSSSQLAKMGRKRKEKDIQPGDLAFFGSRGKVSHVAIVVSKSDKEFRVIHSTSSKGVIESDLKTSKYWQNKYLFTRDVISKT